jgi:indolepyruvate ferredoxin oxidoreductase beta subunit
MKLIWLSAWKFTRPCGPLRLPSDKKGHWSIWDATWQPLPVRLGDKREITSGHILNVCQAADVQAICVDSTHIKDARMQNMALLGTLARHQVIPGVDRAHYHQALADLLIGKMLEENAAIFNAYAG